MPPWGRLGPDSEAFTPASLIFFVFVVPREPSCTNINKRGASRQPSFQINAIGVLIGGDLESMFSAPCHGIEIPPWGRLRPDSEAFAPASVMVWFVVFCAPPEPTCSNRNASESIGATQFSN